MQLDELSASFDRSSGDSHEREENKGDNTKGTSSKEENLFILDSTSESKNLTTNLSGNSKGNIGNDTEQLVDFFINKFEIMKVIKDEAEENNNTMKINQTIMHGTEWDAGESRKGLGKNSISDNIKNDGAIENLKIEDISKV